VIDPIRLENEAHDESLPIRRSNRTTKQPSRFQDFVTYHATPYPIQEVVRYDKVSSKFYSFLTHIERGFVPNTFGEAKLDNNWVNAMNEELEALKRNQTWDLVKLPSGK
jgi:hypothetical protein